MGMQLVRDHSSDFCTLGILTLPNGVRLYTIERPWIPDPVCKSGRKYESCVSEGTYRLERHDSEKFGDVWALVNHDLDVYHYPYDVPPGREWAVRTAILIHAGNWVRDVIGCIAPGTSRVRLKGEWMVQNSRNALRMLTAAMWEWDDHDRLEIVWTPDARPHTSSGGASAV